MNVPNNVFDDFLEVYTPSAKYLISANEAYPSLEGVFSIQQSAYITNGISSGHLNMVDLLICYNQLVYVGIANALKHRRIPELADISYEIFRDNKLNGLIYSLDKIKFRQPISSDHFSGRIIIDRIRNMEGTHFVKTKYDFEHKTAGEINLAIRLIDNAT